MPTNYPGAHSHSWWHATLQTAGQCRQRLIRHTKLTDCHAHTAQHSIQGCLIWPSAAVRPAPRTINYSYWTKPSSQHTHTPDAITTVLPCPITSASWLLLAHAHPYCQLEALHTNQLSRV